MTRKTTVFRKGYLKSGRNYFKVTEKDGRYFVNDTSYHEYEFDSTDTDTLSNMLSDKLGFEVTVEPTDTKVVEKDNCWNSCYHEVDPFMYYRKVELIELSPDLVTAYVTQQARVDEVSAYNGE